MKLLLIGLALLTSTASFARAFDTYTCEKAEGYYFISVPFTEWGKREKGTETITIDVLNKNHISV